MARLLVDGKKLWISDQHWQLAVRSGLGVLQNLGNASGWEELEFQKKNRIKSEGGGLQTTTAWQESERPDRTGRLGRNRALRGWLKQLH